MSHSNHVSSASADAQSTSPLPLTFWLTVGLIALLAVGAWRSHSLALWADAGHTLTDLAAIGLSWYAFRQLRRPPTARMSFGFARIEVLVAFANALLLAAVAITLVAESVVQWRHPVVSNPSLMMLTAAIALGIYGGLVLGFHHQDNLNLYGTWLHLLSDAASSLAVLVGGALLAITHWMPINPLLTILIAAAMIVSTGRILREGLGILMEATPPGIEPTAITEVLQAVDGVERIHDLHIWRIGSGQTALACHVGVGPRWAGHDPQILLCELHDALESIGINHVTIQLEHGEETHHEPW